MSAAALVMARAPRPGRAKTRLQALLGAEGCAALQAVLIGRATRWARDVGTAFVAIDPPDALGELRELLGDGVELLAQRGADLGARLRAASADVFERHGGPLLVVGTDLPLLRADHASAALDDLAAGCDVSLGPALDGGYYLIALARERPQLFELPAHAWGGPEVLALTLALAARERLSLGLLRSERDLDTPDDVRALLADPLAPAELRELLR